MKLRNKVAVVTGAAGGMGSAIVRELDREGVKCILFSKSEDKTKKLINSLSSEGHTFYLADFRDTKEIEKVIKRILKDLNKIDLLFNVAGIGIYKGIEDITLKEWDDSISVNLTAPFLLTKGLIPLLKKSKDSVVVSIGSVLGTAPLDPNRIAYIVSKFGLRGLNLALSKDYERKIPRFCLITLGSTLTDFGPGELKDRLRKQKEGKKYFTPKWVAKKLIEIIKNDEVKDEITLFPTEQLK
ncbi:SDR family NAD(P)-dependent oxidoreductase [Patescibacteria group bacterium]|nr:SDR family NAD(P)-dependent oxidoreductase [Patescibacteria group bacterium]